MAAFPPPPGPRIPYHLDGSVLFYCDFNSFDNPVLQPQGELERWNNEEVTNVGFDKRAVLVFPYPVDLVGLGWFRGPGTLTVGANPGVWVSSDTVTGFDGVWDKKATSGQAAVVGAAMMRGSILGVSVDGVRGVYWQTLANKSTSYFQPQKVHLYGQPADYDDLPGLVFWHPTLNQPLDGAAFDFGDATRGTGYTKTFRIKNNNQLQDAVDVGVSLDALTDPSPSLAGQFGFNTASSQVIANPKNIGTIEAGSISPVVTMNYDVNVAAALGLSWGNVHAVADDWD